MGIATFYALTYLSPLVIVAMPVAIWALLKKAGELRNQPEGFSHKAKRIWCYILIAASGLLEIAAIVMFINSIQHNVYGDGIASFLPLLFIHSSLRAWLIAVAVMLLPLAPLGIWWKNASRKELMATRPSGYYANALACKIWIVALVIWLVIGLVLLVPLIGFDKYFLTHTGW